MEENKKIKISLKTVIIMACIIIAIIAIFKYYIKNEVYIYNEEIESIVIKYYEGYNIATGNIISDRIPLNHIELDANDLQEVSNLIKNLTKVKYSKDDEMYGHIQYDYICDYYKLEINNVFTIYIGDQYGIVDGSNDYFKVPEALYKRVLEIVQNYNEKNIYKKINSEKISIIFNEEVFEVTDEEQLRELSNYQYYVINASDDDFRTEKVIYTLDLGDGRKIDIYKAGVLSCIYYENGVHEYIYTGSLGTYVEKIFENI